MVNLRRISVVVLVSFVLHFIWETAHIGLYTGYEHITRLPITLYATFGDVVYVLFGVVLVALCKQSLVWLDEPKRNDAAYLAIVGFLIATFVEYKGLMLGKWSYLPTMPIVPILRIGLSPLLQMTLLIPISVWLSAQLRSKVVFKRRLGLS